MAPSRPRLHRLLVAAALTLSYGASADPDAPCYFPNGTQAETFLPCEQHEYITHCCPSGWTCYSNGLCVITDQAAADANSTLPVGTTIRGTCTNPHWNTDICGGFCLDIENSDGALQACGNDLFCCAHAAEQGLCNCDTNNNTFPVASGVVQTIIGVEGLQSTQTSTVTPSATGGSNKVTATGHSGTSAPNASSTPLTKTKKFKIGIAVGCSVVGLAAILALLWCCLRGGRRSNRHNGHQSANASPSEADGDIDLTTQLPKAGQPTSSNQPSELHGEHNTHQNMATEAQRPPSPPSPTQPYEDWASRPGILPHR